MFHSSFIDIPLTLIPFSKQYPPAWIQYLKPPPDSGDPKASIFSKVIVELPLLFPWILKSKFNLIAQAMNIKIINTYHFFFIIVNFCDKNRPLKLNFRRKRLHVGCKINIFDKTERILKMDRSLRYYWFIAILAGIIILFNQLIYIEQLYRHEKTIRVK